MNAETFSSAYEREPIPKQRHGAEEEQLLEAPQAWSQAFGYILHDHLSGSPQAVDQKDFNTFSAAYLQWFHSDFSTLYERSAERATALNTEDAYAVLSHLNFHMINRIMLPIWQDTLFNEHGIQEHSAKEAQTVLALYGMELFKERQGKVTDGTLFMPASFEYRKTNNGMLNEYDAAITLLNISLKDPDVAILPGPFQFEQQHSSKNSDFIALRRSTGQARGIQVKSSRTEDSYRAYDQRYVTLVDGVADLGNTYAMRINPKRSNKVSVVWPGLISLEYLKNLKLDHKLNNLNKKTILQAKFQAHALSKATKPQIAQATERIRTRILGDLEREDSLIR